jgi:hypothetical protein
MLHYVNVVVTGECGGNDTNPMMSEDGDLCEFCSVGLPSRNELVSFPRNKAARLAKAQPGCGRGLLLND